MPPESVPRVGVTWGARPYEKYVPYSRALERAGAQVVKLDVRGLPPGDPLARVDALLLPGGGDVDPVRYGAVVTHPAVAPEPDLDRLELELAGRAVAQGTPLLGICRGLQVLNVALGGTLIQDLPAAGYDRVDHSRYHEMLVDPSRLEEICGAAVVQVNSRHHQGILDLAPALHVGARSPDGLIEAVETDDGLALAVQSHPEDLVDADWARRLFRRLVDLARRSA